jgi:hypothetical protein
MVSETTIPLDEHLICVKLTEKSMVFKCLADAGDVSDTQRKIQRKCTSTNPQTTTDAKKLTSYLKKQNHKHPNLCMCL